MPVFILSDRKYFIQSPTKQQVKAASKPLPNLNLQTEIIGCGFKDKTWISKTANHTGMNSA